MRKHFFIINVDVIYSYKPIGKQAKKLPITLIISRIPLRDQDLYDLGILRRRKEIFIKMLFTKQFTHFLRVYRSVRVLHAFGISNYSKTVKYKPILKKYSFSTSSGYSLSKWRRNNLRNFFPSRKPLGTKFNEFTIPASGY